MSAMEGLTADKNACRVHALNLDSGSDATSPVVISASVSFPVWATNVTFDAAVQSQQASTGPFTPPSTSHRHTCFNAPYL